MQVYVPIMEFDDGSIWVKYTSLRIVIRHSIGARGDETGTHIPTLLQEDFGKFNPCKKTFDIYTVISWFDVVRTKTSGNPPQKKKKSVLRVR